MSSAVFLSYWQEENTHTHRSQNSLHSFLVLQYVGRNVFMFVFKIKNEQYETKWSMYILTI